MAGTQDKKRANLRDVAKAAEVSVATVSRVLNAPDAVSPKTRERVEAAIRTLRFVPSAAARAINSGRTRFVGALVPTLDNAIFARFLAALEKTLGAHQLSLVVATTETAPGVEATKAKGLIDIGAEGLIVTGVSHSAEFYALIERTMLPTISTSYYDAGNQMPTIGYDNAAAAQIALTHLAELGHRRITVIHGNARSNDRTQARLSGLRALDLGLELSCFETEISLRGGSAVVEDIYADSPRPDAILCLSDVVALGVLFGLQGRGIAVPDDVSLMGIDDLPSSAVAVPALTTVHLPVTRMGERAAEALARWVAHQEVPGSERLPASLVKRDSTAKRVAR
ncbi:LacI family DNA-binding transcriptional regulator [Ruegeria sp. 2205SS24-7]|uniref:LacI family DNA-binding transcriptional regulator n=1 Tax=Ruegeria discodermiae TaxID=3064389 RepID=UPI002740B462|nr:LacI family DNA-binding transcriptional regulator [Ruegeria sp. 2205SS24-7]MDP5217308.1 LacI family DNA-binding transcriptional regulator [Ruegeria sp. 2205SS24-7]